MCKCFTTAGDAHDNTVLMICGHRPDCPEFKIIPHEFAENVLKEAKRISDKILLEEMPKLKAMYAPQKKRESKISEGLIQTRMFWWLQKKGHRWIVPNFQAFYTGEMDVCSVMKSGLVNEYEIKISRSDFRADLKKKGKHPVIERILKTGELIERRPRYSGNGVLEIQISAPNFFYYVVPNDLVKPDEVPPYAGLIYVHPNNLCNFRTIKKAIRIHKEPLSTEKKYKIAESLMWRFWNMKEKQENL